MKQANFNVFEDELLSIENEEIRNQTIEVLSSVHDKFFTAPASTSGKYHPKYALGDGGLVRHTKAAVKIANSLFETDVFYFTSDMRDFIRAALLLHDTCKCGIEWQSEHTVHEHSILVQQVIECTLGVCRYSNIVGNLIKPHMGKWNTSKRSDVVLPVPSSAAEEFIHMCDYLASRSFIDIDFNI